MSNEVNVVQAGGYQVSGNRQGQVTYKYPDGVSLYAYPELTQICELLNRRMPGDLRYLKSGSQG